MLEMFWILIAPTVYIMLKYNFQLYIQQCKFQLDAAHHYEIKINRFRLLIARVSGSDIPSSNFNATANGTRFLHSLFVLFSFRFSLH